MILPEAKIILCKRNPLDTCLSIFQQNFPIKGSEYSFNLVEIGKYYNLYTDCIKHWKNINKKMFYEIKYENFVKNQENMDKSRDLPRGFQSKAHRYIPMRFSVESS